MRSVFFLTLCAILCLLMGCQQPPDPIREATAKLKPVVDAYLRAWNTGKLDVLDTICVSGVVRYDRTTGVARGLDSLKDFIKSIRATYPDFKVTAVEELYLPDHAVVRWTITGTNTGPGGFTPTGRSFKATGLSLSDFTNSKLAVEHAEYDRSAVLLQLGVPLPNWTEGKKGKK
jgi:predicted ester cyclase